MDEIERRLAPGKARILEDIVRGIPLEEALARTVRLVEAESPEEVFGSALLADQRIRQLSPAAAPSLAPEYVREIGTVEIGPRAGSCGTAAYRGEPVIVSDIGSDDLWQSYRGTARKYGLRSCWSVPIRGEGGRVLGTFAIYSRKQRSPSRFELDLLGAASDLAAVAIEKDQRRRLSRRLAAEHARLHSLREEDSLLRQVIQTAPSMIAITEGNDHTIRLANAGFAAAAGVDESTIVGRPLLDVVNCIEPRSLRAILDGVFLRGRGFSRKEMRLTLHQPGGKFLHAFVDFLCQRIETGGQASGILLQAVDVTAPVQAREEIRRLQEVKDEFLEALAHDLRNPATIIGGNAAIMLRALDAGAYDRQLFRESLESIAVTAHRLSIRSREIMDMLRMEAGQPIQVLREPVDIVALTRQVLADFGRAGDPHPTEVHCSEDSIIGDWDPVHIETALVNLVSNALKFSPVDRPVRVDIFREPASVRIDVIDRGPGIRPRDLARLFDRYWRAPQLKERRGAGIGLSSAKRSVELLGGSIAAASRIGHGSTFTITLPL